MRTLWRRCELELLSSPFTPNLSIPPPSPSLSNHLLLQYPCPSFPHCLPPSSFFSLTKLYYSYSVFAGILLQFYVPMDFLESPVYRKLRLNLLEQRWPQLEKHLFLIFQLLFRTLAMLVTGALVLHILNAKSIMKLLWHCCTLINQECSFVNICRGCY